MLRDFTRVATLREKNSRGFGIARKDTLRTFAALSRAALLRDGHADLSFTMTVWIGLVTAGNSHFVGNLLLELCPKSLEKIPKVIIF